MSTIVQPKKNIVSHHPQVGERNDEDIVCDTVWGVGAIWAVGL
jgi:hypothetical protein